jgi:Prokaryotic E2 domain/Cysteine-rich domain, C-terminal to E2 domain
MRSESLNKKPLLRVSAPDWIQVEAETADTFLVRAQPTGHQTRTPTRCYNLYIEAARPVVAVRESSPGALLPVCCPERHINVDSTFCLGVTTDTDVLDGETAGQWWSRLNQYLRCQDYAHRLRKWPIGHGLSHGGAGEIEVIAENVARRMGLLDEYREGVQLGRGWVGGPLPRIAKDGSRLVNGRLPCPRNCVDKNRRPRLRRECLRACSMGDQLPKLVALERRRRLETERFFDELRNKGIQCCGTMNCCPLRRKGCATGPASP